MGVYVRELVLELCKEDESIRSDSGAVRPSCSELWSEELDDVGGGEYAVIISGIVLGVALFNTLDVIGTLADEVRGTDFDVLVLESVSV